MRVASLSYSILRGVNRLLALFINRFKSRPKSTSLIVLTFLVSLGYFILWRVHSSKWGRYYWNYWGTIHPVLLLLLPKGNWGPIERPPRWIEEIYQAPWMGEWEVPELSKPVFHSDFQSHNSEVSESSWQSQYLASPVIAKLHVFSTATTKGRIKRELIRELSPLLNIPPAYRHLFELKFVLGHALKDNWELDEQVEAELRAEQEEFGDLLQLDLKNGENLREGKILQWMHSVGMGHDGGREAWWLFKIDDDTVPNLPVFLDTLLTLDAEQPYYLGTSLVRWPGYHHHFTGILTGFSWPLLKTLAAGIDEMSKEEIEVWWDDDVLTGELMFDLPSAPHCQLPPPPYDPPSYVPPHGHRPPPPPPPPRPLPAYCDPHEPPPWGWEGPAPSVDPRTGLNRYDFLRRMGDPGWIWLKGDVARHGWPFKPPAGYRKEWESRVKGKMWKPPKWLEEYADPNLL